MSFMIVITNRTDSGGNLGGQTIGLRPFTGYEVVLSPSNFTLEFAADRLLGTVQYLFENGPVLKNGETLGTSTSEKFEISENPDCDT